MKKAEIPLSTKDVEQFYADGGGQRMWSYAFATEPIRAYLGEEVTPVSTIQTSFFRCKHLIEVGCGYGRHLPWAQQQNLRYDGIDLVDWLVELGKDFHSSALKETEAYQLHIASILDIGSLALLQPSKSESLVFFPFNCFGILPDPDPILEKLSTYGLPIYLSVFDAGVTASEQRKTYYQQLGYTNLQEKRDEKGTLFTSQEGLFSYAYHENYLSLLLAKYDYKLHQSFAFSSLARSFVFFRD